MECRLRVGESLHQFGRERVKRGTDMVAQVRHTFEWRLVLLASFGKSRALNNF